MPSDQHPKRGAKRGERGNLQKCDYPIQERVQIVKLLNLSCPLNMDPMIQIEIFIVCTKNISLHLIRSQSSNGPCFFITGGIQRLRLILLPLASLSFLLFSFIFFNILPLFFAHALPPWLRPKISVVL